jgi:KaiC/GvpD/RAD55 family RecA-like ATPase
MVSFPYLYVRFSVVSAVDIPIDIPGLTQFISSIPAGNVLLIRGEADQVKSYFAQYLGVRAKQVGDKVSLITSRGKEDVLKDLRSFFGEKAQIDLSEDVTWTKWLGQVKPETVLIIDSFSFMMHGQATQTIRATVEELRRAVKHSNSLVILVSDDGMLEKTNEALLAHLMDGIVVFVTKETSEGISRFIRIQRWMDGRAFDNNIFYTFDERRINVDLRYRVV